MDRGLSSNLDTTRRPVIIDRATHASRAVSAPNNDVQAEIQNEQQIAHNRIAELIRTAEEQAAKGDTDDAYRTLETAHIIAQYMGDTSEVEEVMAARPLLHRSSSGTK